MTWCVSPPRDSIDSRSFRQAHRKIIPKIPILPEEKLTELIQSSKSTRLFSHSRRGTRNSHAQSLAMSRRGDQFPLVGTRIHHLHSSNQSLRCVPSVQVLESLKPLERLATSYEKPGKRACLSACPIPYGNLVKRKCSAMESCPI